MTPAQPGQPETVAGPATRAGENLLNRLRPPVYWDDIAPSLLNRVLAIEAESAAAARVEAFADIRRGVEAAPVLMREMFGSGDDRTVTDLIDRAAVTALLPSVPPKDGT